MFRLFLLFSLAISSIAYGQQVLSPSNFLSPNNKTQDTSESVANVWELPSGGFLFTYREDIPGNLVNWSYVSSATVVKANINGVVQAKFTAHRDTNSILKAVHQPLHALLSGSEIIFFVTIDSLVYGENLVNKGLMAFHLDSGTLQFKSADTFYTVLPKFASLAKIFSLSHGNRDIYQLLSYYYPLPALPSGNKLLKFRPIGNKIELVANIDLDSMLYFQPYNFNQLFSGSWDESGDSLELFINAYDSSNQQALKMVHIDTGLTSSSVINLPSNQYFYSGTKYIEPDVVLQGFQAKDKIIAGPHFDNEVLKIVGLVKVDIATGLYEKALLIPDSQSLSYLWKTAPLYGGIARRGTDVYCMSFDFEKPTAIHFYFDENHIYVGKTDTSLAKWKWYRFIGFPQKHILPYKIIATSDGGAIITAGIWDYINSANVEHDIYIIKLDANGGITHVSNLTTHSGIAVTVYPVPAQQEVFVSYSGTGKFDFYLYDLSGRLISTQKGFTQGSNRFSVSALPGGQYVYKILFSDGRQETGKLLKQ